MTRKLPPFASVRAFESAARHCSFKKAGEELTLTPSAISHQVKSLEEFLGVKLFFRRRNNLILTDAGLQYVPELTEILNKLEITTERIISRRDKTNLTINLFPSLASNWLMSRMASLREHYPDINVRLVTSLKPLDFKSSEIDFAIRYHKKEDIGSAVKPGYLADLLFDETIIPVCSEKYITDSQPFDDISASLNKSLIFCDTEPEEWPLWCAAVDIVYKKPLQQIDVDNRGLALRAALDGLGIAMGRSPLHDDYIAKGQLITPFPFDFMTGYAYYLVYPERNKKMPSTKKFREWLLRICTPHQLGGKR